MSDGTVMGYCRSCGDWVRGRPVAAVATGSGAGADIVTGHKGCKGPSRNDPTRTRRHLG